MALNILGPAFVTIASNEYTKINYPGIGGNNMSKFKYNHCKRSPYPEIDDTNFNCTLWTLKYVCVMEFLLFSY